MTVLDIQRMSSEDGPGLRTTVFLKGCPLRCRWCHNPESISPKGEVLWHAARCIACGNCGGTGPNRTFEAAEACPTGALEAKGVPWDAPELCRELLKDRAYWGVDGGVTVSGGEPLMQEGVIALLRLLKTQGVHTALDTCGLAPEERLRRALPLCDLVLFDLKLAYSARHVEWTGAGNEEILRNLQLTAQWARRGLGRLWIRTPVVPGATDGEDNIRGIAELLGQYGGAVERWELCAFNNLCAAKYRSLGRIWEFEGAPLMGKAKMEKLLDIAKSTGLDARYTGAVAA